MALSGNCQDCRSPAYHESSIVGPSIMQGSVARRVSPLVVRDPCVAVSEHSPIYVHPPPHVERPHVPTITEHVYCEPAPRTWLEPGPEPRTYIVAQEKPQETLLGKKVDIVEHERVVKALEKRLADMEKRLSESTQAASQTAREKALLQDKCRTLEERAVHLSGLQNTVDTLLAEKRRLEEHIQQISGRSGDTTKLQTDLAQVTEKCSRLAAENRHLDGELQAMARSRDSLAQERNILAGELSSLEKELMQGAAGVRSVKSQMQVRISELEAELQELISTLRARDIEVKELRAQLHDKDGVALDMERLKADNIALIREVERLTNEIRHLEMELRDLARLRAELAELRAENERLLANANARPMLGVEIKMLDDAVGNPDSVVVVHTVTPHGPADMAGILAGDILKEWDGMLLDSKSKFQRLVDQSPPGTRIILTVIRGKAVLDIPIVMGTATGHHLRTHRRVHSKTIAENVVQEPNYNSRFDGTAGRPGRYYPYE